LATELESTVLGRGDLREGGEAVREAFEKWWSDMEQDLPEVDPVDPAGQTAAAEAAWEESRRQAVEACAAEVEAVRCVCESLIGQWDVKRESNMTIREHDPRCPKAQAARLRRLA
jgi:hypothetical protein